MQYTWWIHNNLCKGVRKVISSCAVWAIRNMKMENIFLSWKAKKKKRNFWKKNNIITLYMVLL